MLRQYRFAEAGHQQVLHIHEGKWVSPLACRKIPVTAGSLEFSRVKDSPNVSMCGLQGRGDSRGRVSRPIAGSKLNSGNGICPWCLSKFATVFGKTEVVSGLGEIIAWLLDKS